MESGLVIGGLGGGGDVGLALIIVEGFRLRGSVSAIVSFNKCWAGGRRGIGDRVRGALARIDRGHGLGRRVFEDKLYRVVGWVREVYMLCTQEAWRSIIEGLEWAIARFEPDCMLLADIGGDGVLLGYESRLGSYTTDTIARAALAWASREYGVRGVIAAGGIGAEGGGGELSLVDLYATISYLAQKKAILGGWTPKPTHTRVAHALLELAESGMLPLYLAAVEGKRRVAIRQAYLSGEYEVKPWYKYVLFLDAEKLCSLAPLCAAAHRGEAGLRRWRQAKPPRDYAHLHKQAAKAAREGMLEQKLTALLERVASRPRQPCPA